MFGFQCLFVLGDDVFQCYFSGLLTSHLVQGFQCHFSVRLVL